MKDKITGRRHIVGAEIGKLWSAAAAAVTVPIASPAVVIAAEDDDDDATAAGSPVAGGVLITRISGTASDWSDDSDSVDGNRDATGLDFFHLRSAGVTRGSSLLDGRRR